MELISRFNGSPTSVLLMAGAVAVAIALVWRLLPSIFALCAGAAIAWKLDVYPQFAKAYRYAEAQISMPVNQVHVAQFGLGLAAGLIIFSTIFFVRTAAQLALVATTAAILYVLGTEGVPGLMRHTAAALHLFQEFDFFAKGLVAGKFCAGLMKWKHVQHRRG